MQKNIIIKKNEDFILPITWLGKEDSLSYNINLSERGAKITLLGLLLGNNQDSLELRVNIFHNAPETKSQVIFKGALFNEAKINFEGLVKINPGAKGTNAWQGCHILLLSDKAKGRAIPSLEILENDIKAGHAATVGKISELEIFYLMSRGFSEKQAKVLIMQGFLESLISKLPQSLINKSRKKLNNLDLPKQL